MCTDISRLSTTLNFEATFFVSSLESTRSRADDARATHSTLIRVTRTRTQTLSCAPTFIHIIPMFRTGVVVVVVVVVSGEPSRARCSSKRTEQSRAPNNNVNLAYGIWLWHVMCTNACMPMLPMLLPRLFYLFWFCAQLVLCLRRLDDRSRYAHNRACATRLRRVVTTSRAEFNALN